MEIKIDLSNDLSKMTSYLAGGWFTPQQVKVYDGVCRLLKKHKVYDRFFVPRDLGINLAPVAPEKRDGILPYVFALDTGMIIYSNTRRGFMLALIDDFDPGMIWEMGMAFGMSNGKYPVVTYSHVGHGLNAFFRKSVIGHIKGEKDLEVFLSELSIYGEEDLLVIARDYQDFGTDWK